MKNTLKRTLSILLTLAMLLSTAVFSYAAVIESGKCGDNVAYELYDNGELIISGTGDMYNYAYTVHSPFYDNKNIKKIVINKGVTSIGMNAFENCRGLTSVTIPDSVTSFGKWAFGQCNNISEVHINDLAAWCGIDFSFYSNPLTYGAKLYINGVEAKDITIPDTVTSIKMYAFSGCTGLISVTIPGSVTSIGEGAFDDCSSLTSVTIPDSVTSIGYFAFCKCSSLASVTIPDSVTYIGDNAFMYCSSLASVTIPDSVTYIGIGAFSGCSSLTSINVDSSNTEYSSVDGVLFNKDKSIIACCPGGKTGSYSIPSTVTTIGWHAFYYCEGLTSVTIPSSVTHIDNGAFFECKGLTSVIIPDSVTYIDNSAFNWCTGLTYVTIPDSVTFIGNGAFIYCTGLTSVTIPSSVTSISDSVFGSCSSLTSVTIPSSVTSIGEGAFWECSTLKDVYYQGSEKDWKKIVIANDNDDLTSAKIHYNCTSKIETSEVKDAKKGFIYLGIDSPAFYSESFNVKSNNGTSKISDKKMFEIRKSEATDISGKNGGKITISKKSFYDYIIPPEAIKTFPTKKLIKFTLTKDMKDGKPYISTVFGKNDYPGAEYIDITQNEMRYSKDYKCDIIITAVGGNKVISDYVLSQDNAHKLTSKDGKFLSKDLHKTFDYEKAVYAYIKTTDGTVSEPVKINLTKEIPSDKNLETFLKNTTFSLIGKGAQSIKIPDYFPAVGGSEIDLSLLSFPVGADIKGNDVKISVGFDAFSIDKDGFEWAKMKDQIKTIKDSLKDSKEAKKEYRKFAKKYVKKDKIINKHKYKNKGGIFDADILGYIEAEYINGNFIIKDSSLSLIFSFYFSYTQQAAMWVIPVYLSFEAGAEASVAGYAKRAAADSEIPFNAGIKVALEPELSLEGGAGVKGAASAGIKGIGSLPIEYESDPNHIAVSLNGKLKIVAEVFVVKGEIPLLEGEYQLVDHYFGKKSAPKRMPKKLTCTGYDPYAVNVQVTDRNYLEYDSGWLGEYPPISTFAVMQDNLTFRPLQEGVFPNPQTRLVSIGDKLMMTWIEDDKSRDAYNRMKLVYSIYDPAADTWSAPEAVYDDGCLDASPSIVSDGTKTYITWQKVCKKQTAEDSTGIDSILNNTEIFMAEYDAAKGCFINPQRLTDNQNYETMSTVSINNGNPVVYIASVVNNDINNCSILKYENNTLSTVKENLGYISKIAAADNELTYITDTDGNIATAGDVSLFTLKDGKDIPFGGEGNNNSLYEFMYGEPDGKRTLFVISNSNIFYEENGEIKSVLSERRKIAGNVCTFGNQILWTENTDKGSAVISTVYENGAWTQPVEIGGCSDLIENMNIAIAGNKLHGICSRAELIKNETTGTVEKGVTKLYSFSAEDFSNVSLDFLSYDESKFEPGQAGIFSLYIKNNGTLPVSTLDFNINDGKGNEYTVTKDVNINSGDDKILTFDYTPPAVYTASTLTVTAVLPEDKDNSDNSVSMETGTCDLTVSCEKAISEDDFYIIKTNVYNNSMAGAENVKITVKNQESGEEIISEDLGTLSGKTFTSPEIKLDKVLMPLEENASGNIEICISSASSESNKENNSASVILTNQKKAQCMHPLTKVIKGTPATCTAEGKADTTVCSCCGETISGGETLPKIDHTAGEKVKENEIFSTCTTAGSYDEVIYCTVCKSEISRKTVILEKLPHIPGETVREKEVPPTCTSAGSYDEVIYCTVCKSEISRKNVILETLPHTEEILPGILPTCTKDGLTEGSHCSVCGKVIKAQKKLSATGHKWDDGEVTTLPGCTQTGVKTFTCTQCGKTYTEEIKASGHNMTEISGVKATCTTAGNNKYYHCTVCDKYFKDIKGKTETTVKAEELKMLPHTEVTDKAVAPTCTKDGLTEGSHCSVCGKVIKAQKVLSATGHKWDDGKITKAPTVTADGIKTYKCTVCGEIKTETIPKLDFTPGDTDKDGKVTAADARFALRASVGLETKTAELIKIADMDKDGRITAADARIILRKSVGLDK